MSLTDFGNMTGTADGIGSTTKAVGTAMRELSVSDMIASIADGIAKAQATLDKNGIAQFAAMANTTIDIGDGKKYTMLQLGFAPHFYFFQKVTIDVSFELKFHYEEDQTIGLGASLNVGGGLDASKSTTTTTSTAQKDRQDLAAAEQDLANAKKGQDAAAAALLAAQQEKSKVPETYPDLKVAADAVNAEKAKTTPDQTVITANQTKADAYNKKVKDADDKVADAQKRKADADANVDAAQRQRDIAAQPVSKTTPTTTTTQPQTTQPQTNAPTTTTP